MGGAGVEWLGSMWNGRSQIEVGGVRVDWEEPKCSG